MKGALCKNKAVKGAVDDIANGAGKNKRHAQYQPCFSVVFNDEVKQNTNTGNSDKPENTQGQLSPAAGQLHAKGHAVVFGEIKIKPMVENRDIASQGQGEFYVKLYCLIQNQHQKDDKSRFFQNSAFKTNLSC